MNNSKFTITFSAIISALLLSIAFIKPANASVCHQQFNERIDEFNIEE